MMGSGNSEKSFPLRSVTIRNGTPPTKAAQSNGSAASPAKEMTAQEKREALILELRQRFLAGSYRPDANDIARKLVDAHLEK